MDPSGTSAKTLLLSMSLTVALSLSVMRIPSSVATEVLMISAVPSALTMAAAIPGAGFSAVGMVTVTPSKSLGTSTSLTDSPSFGVSVTIFTPLGYLVV